MIKVKRLERGSVVVELAIAFPLLLMIIGGSYELTRLVKLHDRLNFASRVATNRTMRECTGELILVNPPSPLTVPQAVDSCIKGRVADSIRTVAQGLATDMDILVSVYTYDAASGATTLQGRRWISVTSDTGGTECSDGIDNDMDGGIDTSDDLCSSLGDTSESDGSGFISKFNVARVSDPSGTLLPVIRRNGNLVVAEVIARFDASLANLAALKALNGSTQYAASIL